MPDIPLEIHSDTWELGNETLWNDKWTALNIKDADKHQDGLKHF